MNDITNICVSSPTYIMLAVVIFALGAMFGAGLQVISEERRFDRRCKLYMRDVLKIPVNIEGEE